MMKIAEEAKRQFAWTNADGYTDNELAETVSELESIITEKLKPVKKALERAAHRFEYLHFGGVKECNGVDTAVASQDVRATLALFGDER